MTAAGGAAEDGPEAPLATTHGLAAEVLYEGAQCDVDMGNAAEAPGGGSRPGRRAPQHTFFPLKGCVRRVLYMPALHESTTIVTGPAAPAKGFKRSKSAWRDDEETVDEKTFGGVGVGGSWAGHECEGDLSAADK